MSDDRPPQNDKRKKVQNLLLNFFMSNKYISTIVFLFFCVVISHFLISQLGFQIVITAFVLLNAVILGMIFTHENFIRLIVVEEEELEEESN